jgi:hypothetical protein
MLKYHIQTVELTSAQASISFNSIPQDFTDLYFLFSTRENATGYTGSYIVGSFNSTTTGYSIRLIEGSGSSVGSGPFTSGTDARIMGVSLGSAPTANTFSSCSLHIPNYTSSSNKSYSSDSVMENNATSSTQELLNGLWSNTSPITSATFTAYFGNNWAAGTSISLYGVKRGADGVVNYPATGGVITTSGGYTIHTFNTSGTLTTAKDLEVEYLVIGGGGGAGKNAGCGAGAGGYRSSVFGETSGGGTSAESKLFLSSGTNYTVTIGAGGAVGTGTNGGDLQPGSNGTNSSFGTITSVGGGGGAPGGNIIFSNVFLRHSGKLGGSGGGSSAYAPDGTTGPVPGGPATSNQGFAGGTATSSGDGIASAGGGGAGGIGQSVTASAGQTRAGSGGAGLSSTITGSSVTRASGGSAWFATAVAGGGGGTGQANGQDNTGGGAGDNGAGGSGVVIIRYLTP